MRTEDLILVSVDDHIVEPPSLAEYLKDHVPAKYKERVPRVIRRDDGTDAWLIAALAAYRHTVTFPRLLRHVPAVRPLKHRAPQTQRRLRREMV